MGDTKRIAVVGAGIAGLVVARDLARAGEQVVVFDKGRAPGGRISTRRDGNHVYDHGAQYFTVSDPLLRDELESWVAAGAAAHWAPHVGRVRDGVLLETVGAMVRYVGLPSMSAVARHLAEGVAVRSGVRVASVRGGGPWEIADDGGDAVGEFDVVLLAIPAPQIAEILGESVLLPRIRKVRMVPTWALLLTFAQPLGLAFDAAFWHPAPLAWVCRDSSKPGRPNGERWVLHASPAWSEDHLDAPPERVAQAMRSELLAFASRTVAVEHEALHLWRYAFPEGDVGGYCLWDRASGLGAAGDWCLPGARFEAAYLSGRALAERVLGMAND